MTKRQKLESERRVLKDYEIHWRNVELLVQFIDQHGNIMPRTKTLLSALQQRRVVNAIKVARSMLLIPSYGQVGPLFKRSLTTLEEEIQQEVHKEVCLETGHLVLRRATDHQAQLKKDREDIETVMLRRPTLTTYKIWFDYEQEQQAEHALRYRQAAAHARKLKAQQLGQAGVDAAKAQALSRVNDKHYDKLYERLTLNPDIPRETDIQPEQAEAAFKDCEKEIRAAPFHEFARLFLREKVSCG
jgi:ribosomal protein S18